MSRSVPTSVPEAVALLRRVHPDSEARTGPDHLAELGGVIEAIPYRWLYWPLAGS